MKTRLRCLIRRHLFLILFAGFIPLAAFPQESGSCAEKLQTAQTLFDRGQVEQVADLLSECMKSGFNREESLAAYKLIIQTYLFEDRLSEADSAMLYFLNRNPEYQLSPTDHSSFVHLFNTFLVKPIVQISLHLGTNLPFMTFVVYRSATGYPSEGEYSTPAVNFYGSLEAKMKMSEKLEMNLEIGYSQLAFTNTEDFLGTGTTTYKETQNRIEIPVSATYNIKSPGKLTPYGRLGLGPALTLNSGANARFDPSDVIGTPRKPADIDRKDSRIVLDLFGQIGAGVKYKTRGGYMFAEVRSNFGVFNQVLRESLPSETHSSAELNNSYYYVDDDFNLNALNFTLGYTQIFYKPSKRKE
ncbi:MAG TPA: hypothetical protein DDY34_11495 [Bacteroidales bacterium]|nr:hypothetical protein [Bacteroidales bacterium]